jgi:KaiC/GvpD/RAD55 family RecA-like ATPase
MDPRTNPYTPNAGAAPPALVGRDDQLESFGLLIDRLQAGYTEQSMIVTGLRGVGKTVLLNRFHDRIESAGWVSIEIEASKHDDSAFRRELALHFRRALLEMAPRERWRSRMHRAAGVLRSFTVSIDQEGTLTAGLNAEAVQGRADSGVIDLDLTDLVVAVGEAAKEHGVGVVLLIDEIQFLTRVQLEALIRSLHKAVQRSLPISMVGAGLPQIAELAGEAKSYAERLFKFPEIGSLSDVDGAKALRDPAATHDVNIDDDAVDGALEFTEGYPYFLQELGYAVWSIASENNIARADVEMARRVVEEKLDSSFFRVRLDRATPLEVAYLRAMAELGPDPHLAGDVAVLLNRTSQQCGPTRSTLVEKGLLYTPQHGFAAFTVPQFDRFMMRAVPELDPPPIRSRAGSRPGDG